MLIIPDVMQCGNCVPMHYCWGWCQTKRRGDCEMSITSSWAGPRPRPPNRDKWQLRVIYFLNRCNFFFLLMSFYFCNSKKIYSSRASWNLDIMDNIQGYIGQKVIMWKGIFNQTNLRQEGTKTTRQHDSKPGWELWWELRGKYLKGDEVEPSRKPQDHTKA